MPTDRGDTMQKCVVDECGRVATNKANALCTAHYHRFWRHGDVQAHIPLAPARAKPQAAIDFEDGTRQCLSCDKRLPLIEGFHSDSRSPLGRRKICKTCRVEKETERYWQDPEHFRSQMRAFRAENPDHVRERERLAYERHKPARIAAATEAAHRRRARMFERAHERGITTTTLRKMDGDQCCYCGVNMIFGNFPKGERPDEMATLEHIVPISKGGTHTWDNCALACWRDNITKGAATEGWEVAPGHRLASGKVPA